MTTESNIVHEAGLFWVCRDTANRAYTVYRIAATHSSADSSYALTPDGLSIAITRCNYLAKRFPDQAAIDRAQAESALRARRDARGMADPLNRLRAICAKGEAIEGKESRHET